MIMHTNAIPAFAQMSPTDFAAIGLNQIAFVKATVVEGQPVFAVHGADGTPLDRGQGPRSRLRRGAAERHGAGQRALSPDGPSCLTCPFVT